MKKLLGILIVSLFFNTTALAFSVYDYIKEGISKKELKKKVQGFGSDKHENTFEIREVKFEHGHFGAVFFGSVYRKYFPEYKIEILSHWYNDKAPPEENFPYYIFENVTEPVTCTGSLICSGSIGNGTLKKMVFSKRDAFLNVNEDYSKKFLEKEKKIAEKPKEQEPGNNQTEKGFELKQTLLNSNLVMKSKKNIHTIEFNQNGTGTWSMGDYSTNIVWEVLDNNTFKAHAPKYNYSLATINWNNLTLKYEDNRGDIWNYDIVSPKKLLTLIADKPKKKKPKSSPDDNKIVPAGSGSGFFVSKDGHAITNYHVIEGCDINKLSFKGSQTEVKVLAVDKVNDIAILKSNTKPDVIFPVSNEDVSLLEDVIVAGFPLGKQISSAIKTHKGVVTALAGAGDNYSFFQTDAAINQGNSGGPIINQKGNVVGIAVATWVEEGVQGVHFGIKSSTLKTFASANDLTFASPNYRELSNKDLGKLITKGTVYVECHMTVAKIKKMIAQAENRKAFFKHHIN